MRNVNAPEFRHAFERRQRQPIDAVPTHIPKLNKLCGDDGGGVGLARGWFVTVGANPGFGKSAMALNLTAQAMRESEAVGYASLEMTAGQIAARYYAISSGTPVAKLERGRNRFDMTAWQEISSGFDALPPLWVPERIGGDWESVAGFVKGCFDEGCKWFVLDYLQLVQTGDEESINRGMTNIVTDLRQWCANTGATVVCLSQFNRVTSSDYSSPPRCQGLWGGMILEASSDVVLLLDHSRYEREDHSAKTWLIVDKNRHGPIGEIAVHWDYRTLRMTEALPDVVDEWP